jgi:hypothetical protein
MSRGVGQHHLPTVGSGCDARRPMDVHPDVLVLLLIPHRFTRVKTHSHSDAVAVGPVVP